MAYPGGRTARLVCVGLATLVILGTAPASGNGPLLTAQLEIRGNRLTIHPDDVYQVVNVGERRRVRTCYGGATDDCGAIVAGDPRIAGLKVTAELRGPELPQPIPCETVPGGAFYLPGFQQPGEYLLENIRLVSTTTGQVLGAAQPSVVVLSVHQIVLASAEVRTLSLAELQARGITLTQENFQAFRFAVGFAFDDTTVVLDLPVLYEGVDQLTPLEEPQVFFTAGGGAQMEQIRRWRPPSIIPFRLAVSKDEYLGGQGEQNESLSFPLFGAIVIPGNVSFLNQFFDAQLIIVNGAPAGAGVDLADLTGVLKLPGGNVLRLAGTDPPVAPGQKVPVLGDGGSILAPGEQGTAAWTVEGLVAGTHVLTMDVEGEIVRPGEDPTPVRSRVQAAVEVVDARFHLTFSHPDVVREDEDYTLYITVANMSRATQNLISVTLDEDSITGADLIDGSDLEEPIESLEPGESATLEVRLRARLTGQVVASTFKSDSTAGTASIELYTGVGELGIPLSPASLVLSRFTKRLAAPYNDLPDDELLRANVRLLGLAYSLAVAPPAMVPPELPAVIPSDVRQRAIDLAEAGRRTFLREDLLASLEVLALDQLGNRDPLAEYDELRRKLERGRQASAALAALLRRQQDAQGLSAPELFDHFVDTTSYAAPYLAAMLVPAGSAPAPELALRRDGMHLRYPSDADAPVRTLPFGDVFAVAAAPGSVETVPLALVGHVEPDESFEVALHNPGAEDATGTLMLIVPDDQGGYRRLEYANVTVGPGQTAAVTVAPALAAASLAGRAPVVTEVVLPEFRLIGAVQDFKISANRYGHGIVYLFNRPPDPTTAADPASYAIRSTFNGEDTRGQQLSEPRVMINEGAAAFLQNDERVVIVRYRNPVSALTYFSGEPVVAHEHLRLDVRDAGGAFVAPPLPEPWIGTSVEHVGGLVEGYVLRGTGEAVAGARLQLIRKRLIGSTVVLDLVGEIETEADGYYYFDFIESPHPNPMVRRRFLLRATVPAGPDPLMEPAQVEELGSVIREANRNRLGYLNVALLGRGTLTGRLLYVDGTPVTPGQVTAASTLFNDARTAEVDPADGTFVLAGMPVGPLTLTGRDGEGRIVYETVGLETPGAVVDVTLYLAKTPPPGFGTVSGRVLLQPADGAETQVLAGAQVAVYSEGKILAQKETDVYGRFVFEQVPEGHVTIQAADFRVSRTPVLVDLMLARHENAEVELVIHETTSRTVCGTVLSHEPLENADVPVEGAVAFIPGPGVFAYTDADGEYCIESVPVQGAFEKGYRVEAIDNARALHGQVPLPPITDASPDVITTQPIVLREMRGAVEGVVIDPLGRPRGGIDVELAISVNDATVIFGQSETGADGTFVFEDVPLTTSATAVAHLGDGLEPNFVGYFGEAETRVIYGGHQPFLTVPMVGSGVLNVRITSGGSPVGHTPIYYKPIYYSQAAMKIRRRGAYLEEGTNGIGELQLVVPVGSTEVVAFHPFHGYRELSAVVEYAGQVVDVEIELDETATVTGTVVDVDGVTPVPGVEVSLHVKGLLPQTLSSDALGRFRFELVPQGPVKVEAAGVLGGVERVGRADGLITEPGTPLDLTVAMKAQGTVRGRVVDGNGAAVAGAAVYVSENGYPFRRLPVGGRLLTDDQGWYEISHVYAGKVTAMATDGSVWTQAGRTQGVISVDWEVVTLPDVVLSDAPLATLEVTVRDPDTGAPVPDCQIGMSTGEMTVTDDAGTTVFEGLPLGRYRVYGFDAPTGRGGRLDDVRLTATGEILELDLYLDVRGKVEGTLWDDDARTLPRSGGTVHLQGMTAAGSLTALATTSYLAGREGQFRFEGIPEGKFNLTAFVPDSPRRAGAAVELTATSPVQTIDMILEPTGEVYLKLYQSLTTGRSPIDPSAGAFSVAAVQGGDRFERLQPTDPLTFVYRFSDLLLARAVTFSAQELTGEQRSVKRSFPHLDAVTLDGAGTEDDPYQLVLDPKGIAVVHVYDALGAAVAGANVTLQAPGANFPSVTGDDGSIAFFGVPAGTLRVTAAAAGNGGQSTATLTHDDETVDVDVTLAATLSVRGVIYQPPPGDRYGGDPSTLVPQAGAIVEIAYSGGFQLAATGEDGGYRFDAVRPGAFTVDASLQGSPAYAAMSGTVSGAAGSLIVLDPLILDASPPRIESLVPAPGMVNVSRTAPVEIVFSERLRPDVLPDGGNPQNFFRLSSAAGGAAGTWSSALDGDGRQVVRFVPAVSYANQTVYSLTIIGGTGGVRDLVDRPVNPVGNVGTNFKTSDTEGPEVIAVEPDLGRPVDPAEGSAIVFDFSEAVGYPQGSTPVVYSWQSDDSHWHDLPVTFYLTRSDYSLVVEVPDWRYDLAADTLQRRLVLTGLHQADNADNVMAASEWRFRIYDDNPPAISAVPGPPGGVLSQGSAYTLTPELDPATLDDYEPEANPAGDVGVVEYFMLDPDDPSAPAPVYIATVHPFAFDFVAVWLEPEGNFDVWVRATDTSTNLSNVVLVGMTVVANQAPAIDAVTVEALGPVAGTFYPGSQISAAVHGLDDPDSAQLTLTAALWDRTHGLLLDGPTSRPVERPGSWDALAPPLFNFEIPIDLAAGTSLAVEVTAVDAKGAEVTVASEPFAAAADETPPVVTGLVARDLASGAPGSQFHSGDDVYFELRADDGETAVTGVEVGFDSERFDALPATPVPGAGNLYRTASLRVPADLPPAGLAVEVRAAAGDHGGNLGTRTLAITMELVPDQTVPVATWLTPWEGAAWPAAYGTAGGTALLIRALVVDLDDDGGELVPGAIDHVTFYGPEPDAAGVPGTLVPGTGGPGRGVYQAVLTVPDQIAASSLIPFVVEAGDLGGNTVERLVRMEARIPARVYQGVERAILPDAVLPAGGPIFLLDGSTLSIYPAADGAPRRVDELYVYAGGEDLGGGVIALHPSVLTAPEATSYDSAILWYPLDLEVGSVLAVGSGTAVDVSGRGLLGSGDLGSVALPGESAAEGGAGGSYGGRGAAGGAGVRPGSVYGSVRNPRLPGGGGGGGGNSMAIRAGDGGGVIRIDAGGGVLRLAGDVRADGLDGPRYTYSNCAGGAGGAVRLLTGRIEGSGRITANGGAGANQSTGGGGGGRIVVSYRELGGGVDLGAQLVALGGGNQGHQLGGAGTVFIEPADPTTGEWTGLGELRLANGSGLPAAVTPLPALGEATLTAVDPLAAAVTLEAPDLRGELTGERVVFTDGLGEVLAIHPITAQDRIAATTVRLTLNAGEQELDFLAAALALDAVYAHGRARFAAVTAAGSSRLVVDDDLEIGDAGSVPVLNDRSALVLDVEARALLRGEGPVVTITAEPAPGSDLPAGVTINLSWTASDPFGVAETTTDWQFGSPDTTIRTDAPQMVTEQLLLSVPATAPPGDAVFTLTAIDAAQRTVEDSVSWNVLPNAPPSGTLAFVAGTPAAVYPGATIAVTVHAEDAEGLAEIVLHANGPAAPRPQTRPVSGLAADETFELTVHRTALHTEMVTVYAEITDAHGNPPVVTGTLSLGVLEDTESPVVQLSGVGDVYYGGQTLEATIDATDEVGVSELSVTFDGTTEVFTEPSLPLVYAVEVDRTIAAPRTTALEVTAIDYHQHPSAPVSRPIELRPDQEPSVTLSVGPATEVLPGTTLTATVDATDDVAVRTVRFVLSGAVTMDVTRTPNAQNVHEVYRYTLPVNLVAGDQVFLRVEVTDTFDHLVTRNETFTVIADDEPPQVTLALTPAAAGDVYAEGEVVTVTVTATDNVAVDAVSLDVDGEEVASAGDSSLTYEWQLPGVTGTTIYTLEARALDVAGNPDAATRPVIVQPVDTSGLPTVRFDCPTTGAYLPSGYDAFTLGVSAEDADGIDTVELYRGDESTPFHTADTSGSPVTVQAADVLPVVAGEEIVRYRVRAYDFGGNFNEAVADVHVVPAVDLDAAGGNDWPALASQVAVLRGGTLTVDEPGTLGGLIVLPGASITHSATAAVDLTVGGPVYVACGAAIDVSGRGYGANVTYPGETAPGYLVGGSHMGYGGRYSTDRAHGSTYGSVYRPREHGGGGEDGSAGMRGGGAIRLRTSSLAVDGAIRANGAAATKHGARGGAGGAVWITAGSISGDGIIEALGGPSGGASYGSGGGGAIAVEYDATSGSVLPNLRAYGGNHYREGGAGTVYLFGPTSTYGDLIVDNGTVAGDATVLPALGGGLAVDGSNGATLVTDRGAAIPSYFVGHWVEIYDGITGELTGTWRIGAVAGVEATLVPNGGEEVRIKAGDRWQGVYRVDDFVIKGSLGFSSEDPVRVTGTQEIHGQVEVREIGGHNLVLRGGTVLTHPSTATAAPESLRIDLTGSLVIEPGAAIDVSGRGYAANMTYPGETPPGYLVGGSHMGYGGRYDTDRAHGSTYGSMYRPQENGSGGEDGSNGMRGGGSVRINAPSITLADATSAIRANGAAATKHGARGGAGGAVWITAGSISGDGIIEALGGPSGGASYGSGGGGAIAVDYDATSGSVLPNLRAYGGNHYREGGAGTVYLFGPTSTYGDLIVDNGTLAGDATVLPALGGGLAVEGSNGPTLVTDRSAAIPPYFVGHWVEIYDGITGELTGTWRIGAVAGVEAMLVPNGGEEIRIEAGDRWQGVYLVDDFVVKGTLAFSSEDPVRVTGTQEIDGQVEVREIGGHNLVLRGGTVLTHPSTATAAPESLRIDLTGSLVIEPGAAIDVTGRGYGANMTYPGETTPGYLVGGSHMGYGGRYDTGRAHGSTYGSVYQPQENGSGGEDGSYGMRGGGSVRIIAPSITLADATSAIRANGAAATKHGARGGAGGAVWITAGSISGDGIIEALGGPSGGASYGSGGGGAIAVEYDVTSGSVLPNLRAYGGNHYREGGAGTVYLFGPTSTWGDLLVDNGGLAGEATELPALGTGTALPGTSGPFLLTDRPTAIPPYFVGHWVEITDPLGTVKGTWSIGDVDGTTATLVPNDGESISLTDGDEWKGLYRFDALDVAGNAILISVDEYVVGGKLLARALPENREAPLIDAAAVTISVGSVSGSYRVDVPPAAVADADGIAELRLSDGVSRIVEKWSEGAGASFLWPGVPGQRLTLTVIDAHDALRRGSRLQLPALPAAEWPAPRLALPADERPRFAVAGADWLALADRSVRILEPTGGRLLDQLLPLTGGEPVVGLAAAGDYLVAAHPRQLHVIEIGGAGTWREIPLPAGDVALDLAADEREVVILVRSETGVRLLSLPVAEAMTEPAAGSQAPIPDEFGGYQLRVLAGSVHVVGREGGDLADVLFSFPNRVAGEALTATPETWTVDDGWHFEGSWERGLILVAGTTARLLEWTPEGDWTEAARLELDGEIVAAFGRDRQVAFLLRGEVLVYDLGDPAAPFVAARMAGCAHRNLEMIDPLLLWSSGFAATPVLLEAEDGGAFVPAVDGSGRELW